MANKEMGCAGDNLNLPIIGRIMRTCGAFFIRRSIKNCSDAALYKTCLDRYLRTLMAHGSPTEFFIEGSTLFLACGSRVELHASRPPLAARALPSS